MKISGLKNINSLYNSLDKKFQKQIHKMSKKVIQDIRVSRLKPDCIIKQSVPAEITPVKVEKSFPFIAEDIMTIGGYDSMNFLI